MSERDNLFVVLNGILICKRPGEVKSVNNDSKKQFYALFIDQIEIYPDADWKHGEDIVYKIRFKIPLNYGGERTFELTHLENEEEHQMEKHIQVRHFRDKENTVETVALLYKN